MAGETLGFQVHHVFPVKVMENLEDEFIRAGIKAIGVNDYSNRLNLFDNQAMADNDTIYGGNGNDLIFGGVGNDVIYADDNYNPALVNSTEQGDWVVGGVGHDIIFGSQRKDFLQGGKNDDTIFGGSGDDVILGDGNIRFHQRSKTVGFRG